MANQVENSRTASTATKKTRAAADNARDSADSPGNGGASQGASADDLLAQLAGAEVDRLLKEAESLGGLEVEETAQQRPFARAADASAPGDNADKPKRTSTRTIQAPPLPVAPAASAPAKPEESPVVTAAGGETPADAEDENRKPNPAEFAAHTVAGGQRVAGEALVEEASSAITGERFEATADAEAEVTRGGGFEKAGADADALAAILDNAGGRASDEPARGEKIAADGGLETFGELSELGEFEEQASPNEKLPDEILRDNSIPAAAQAQIIAGADAREDAEPLKAAAAAVLLQGPRAESNISIDESTVETRQEAADRITSEPQSMEQYIERATSAVERELLDSLAESEEDASGERAFGEEVEPKAEKESAAPIGDGPSWLMRILQWINAPVANDRVREVVGKVALVTFFNAVAVLIYVLLFHKKH